MIKHYKVILLIFGVFIAFGVMPAERPQITTFKSKVKNRVVEVLPVDLSKVEENARKIQELKCELQWEVEKNKNKAE